MPNTKTAKKAMRQSERRRVTNLKTKNKLKVAVKTVRKNIDAKNSATIAEDLKKAFSALDKAAKKGVIHKNTADRKKSRLAKAIARIK